MRLVKDARAPQSYCPGQDARRLSRMSTSEGAKQYTPISLRTDSGGGSAALSRSLSLVSCCDSLRTVLSSTAEPTFRHRIMTASFMLQGQDRHNGDHQSAE